jgi:hypothetical protein
MHGLRMKLGESGSHKASKTAPQQREGLAPLCLVELPHLGDGVRQPGTWRAARPQSGPIRPPGTSRTTFFFLSSYWRRR